MPGAVAGRCPSERPVPGPVQSSRGLSSCPSPGEFERRFRAASPAADEAATGVGIPLERSPRGLIEWAAARPADRSRRFDGRKPFDRRGRGVTME